MKILIFIGSLLATTIAADRPVGPQAEIVYHTAFYETGEPQWDDLPISRSFSSRTLASLPRTEGKFVMINLRCKAMTGRGLLTGCKVEVEPNGPNWRRVAEMMARDIRVEPGFARRVAANIQFVNIQVRASNSETEATSGPCWPPSCSFIPAPPPPPPPPPN